MSKIPTSPIRKIKIIKREIDQYIDTGYPIPELYGDDKIVVLPRDPHWVFVYWDLSGEKLKKISGEFLPGKQETSKLVLRVITVAGKREKISSNAVIKDAEVPSVARSWYLNLDDNRKKYILELGVKARDGKFVVLLVSKPFTLPVGKIADAEGKEWMSVSERYGKLLRLSGIDRMNVSSLEIVKFLAKRWELLQIVSPGIFSGISSPRRRLINEKSRKFWLIADAELIVYGATDPAASLYINKNKHELNPDGTFSLRSSFPDGSQEYLIKAVSGDKIEERKITITVERKTK